MKSFRHYVPTTTFVHAWTLFRAKTEAKSNLRLCAVTKNMHYDCKARVT